MHVSVSCHTTNMCYTNGVECVYRWCVMSLSMVCHVLHGSLACVCCGGALEYTPLPCFLRPEKLLLVHGLHGNGLYNIYSTLERDVLLTYPFALEISPNISPSSVLHISPTEWLSNRYTHTHTSLTFIHLCMMLWRLIATCGDDHKEGFYRAI